MDIKSVEVIDINLSVFRSMCIDTNLLRYINICRSIYIDISQSILIDVFRSAHRYISMSLSSLIDIYRSIHFARFLSIYINREISICID
jgi:hypothetical protein